MGLSHILCPDVLNNTSLSQGCVLETAPTVGTVGRTYIPRAGEGNGASDCPGPAHRATSGHILSMSSSNMHINHPASLSCSFTCYWKDQKQVGDRAIGKSLTLTRDVHKHSRSNIINECLPLPPILLRYNWHPTPPLLLSSTLTHAYWVSLQSLQHANFSHASGTARILFPPLRTLFF